MSRYRENERAIITKLANGWLVESRDHLYRTRSHTFRLLPDVWEFLRKEYALDGDAER